MKMPDSPLPSIANGWETAIKNLWNVSVEHWWLFPIAVVAVLIFLAPKK